MNALVISGGGSKGAFAGGVAEHLIKDCKIDYDLFVGTSTGSLLIPFLALGQIDKIKHIYTTIKQKDIFSVCPFIIKKNGDEFTSKINHLGIIKQFLKREKTLGNSENLRKLIKSNLSKKDFIRLKNSHKEVLVSVANLTKQTMEYKSSRDYSYVDFCDWIWASANLLPFMSLYTKNGMDYGDGGFGDLIPVHKAVLHGAKKIDVIVLRPKKNIATHPPLTNALNVLASTYDFMFNQIAMDDITIAKLAAKLQDTKINFFHTNRNLTDQPFIFDAETMTNWWNEGYNQFK